MTGRRLMAVGLAVAVGCASSRDVGVDRSRPPVVQVDDGTQGVRSALIMLADAANLGYPDVLAPRVARPMAGTGSPSQADLDRQRAASIRLAVASQRLSLRWRAKFGTELPRRLGPIPVAYLAPGQWKGLRAAIARVDVHADGGTAMATFPPDVDVAAWTGWSDTNQVRLIRSDQGVWQLDWSAELAGDAAAVDLADAAARRLDAIGADLVTYRGTEADLLATLNE